MKFLLSLRPHLTALKPASFKLFFKYFFQNLFFDVRREIRYSEPKWFATVAQLVERVFRKDEVVRSIRIGSSTNKRSGPPFCLALRQTGVKQSTKRFFRFNLRSHLTKMGTL